MNQEEKEKEITGVIRGRFLCFRCKDSRQEPDQEYHRRFDDEHRQMLIACALQFSYKYKNLHNEAKGKGCLDFPRNNLSKIQPIPHIDRCIFAQYHRSTPFLLILKNHNEPTLLYYPLDF